MEEVKPKVLYVMGAGRSGSTVLGITLGNVSGIFNVGEALAWTTFHGVPSNEKPEAGEFWQNVLERVPNAEKYFGSRFYHEIEHHRALLHPKKSTDPDLSRAYDQCCRELFNAIRKESGCDWIVDTSHYALRAARLRQNPALDTYVIHLVRDPRDVINALQKQVQRDAPMGPFKANLYTLAVWIQGALEFLRFPRAKRIRIHYEDFLDNPVPVVNHIMQHFGCDARLQSASDIPTSRVFQGNRVLSKPSITIKPQPSKQLLSPLWQRISTLLQLPVLLNYGYQIGAPGRASGAGKARGNIGQNEGEQGKAQG